MQEFEQLKEILDLVTVVEALDLHLLLFAVVLVYMLPFLLIALIVWAFISCFYNKKGGKI